MRAARLPQEKGGRVELWQAAKGMVGDSATSKKEGIANGGLLHGVNAKATKQWLNAESTNK